MSRAHGVGDSRTGITVTLSPAIAGSIFYHAHVLGLAPQALCFRPLRGLKDRTK